LEIRMPSKKK